MLTINRNRSNWQQRLSKHTFLLVPFALAFVTPAFSQSLPDAAQGSQSSSQTTLSDLARQISELTRKQNYVAAVAPARTALSMNETERGKDDPSNIEHLNNLGWVLQQTGQFAEARRMFERAIAIAEKNALQNNAYALSLNNLATWLYAQGDYQSALSTFEKAIAVNTRANGAEHITTASILKNEAGVLDALKRGDEAVAAYQKAITIIKKQNPVDKLQLAQALNDLATSLEDKQQYDQALPLLKEAVDVKRELLGPEHSEVADGLNNLAMFYLDSNKLVEAKPLFEQALAINEKVYGPEHVAIVPVLNNLGDLYFLNKDVPAAAKCYLRAGKIVDSYVRNVLPSCSFAEQQAALSGSCREQISRLLSVCRTGEQLSAAYAEFFQWKGMLVESLARESQIRRSSVSPETRQKLQQLSKTRAELSGWYLEAGNVAYDVWKKKNDTLTADKEKLERAIIDSNAALKSEVGELTLQKLASLLKEDEAIVDVFRHNLYNESFDEHPRYSAVITTGGDASQVLVDLQDGLQLEAALKIWRNDVLQLDMAEDSWTQLSRMLLPVFARLPAKTKKVWVCPDGELARVPWQLISDESKLPKRMSCQIDSARELAVLRSRASVDTTGGTDTLLVAGGIDFNAGANPASKPLILMPLLPGTIKEAKDIADIGKTANFQLMELSGAGANKSSLLASLPKANYVHLATHGFFFDENTINSIRPGSRAVAVTARASVTEAAQRNPLVESGIALAGANKGGSGKTAENEGFLTAEEFVGIDLSKCKLITLSACDTGRGKEITGQGVMGLRSSIMAAGANTVLMSLWKIPDVPTVELMKLFYTNLWVKHMPPAEALRSAQKTLTSTWSGDQLAPINWAGWVLVGDGW